MVLSIEAKKSGDSWEVYTENGRQKTGLDVMDWVKIGETQEAGEILLTSVDFEGTKRGFDFDLIKKGNSPNKGIAVKYVFIITARPIHNPEINI